MANQQAAPAHTTTHEIAVHSRDYSRFIGMMKWAGLTAFLLGLIIIKFVL